LVWQGFINEEGATIGRTGAGNRVAVACPQGCHSVLPWVVVADSPAAMRLAASGVHPGALPAVLPERRLAVGSNYCTAAELGIRIEQAQCRRDTDRRRIVGCKGRSIRTAPSEQLDRPVVCIVAVVACIAVGFDKLVVVVVVAVVAVVVGDMLRHHFAAVAGFVVDPVSDKRLRRSSVCLENTNSIATSPSPRSRHQRT